MAPKLRMGLSMTKHNFCPMIKGRKSQNKATRIFVFASIYYSTYYYFTTILCLTKVCLQVIQLPLPVDAPLTNKVEVSEPKRGRDRKRSVRPIFHILPILFNIYLVLKWWVQCLACISVILGFFICNPYDFRSLLRPYFEDKLHATIKLTSNCIDHSHRLF